MSPKSSIRDIEIMRDPAGFFKHRRRQWRLRNSALVAQAGELSVIWWMVKARKKKRGMEYENEGARPTKSDKSMRKTFHCADGFPPPCSVLPLLSLPLRFSACSHSPIPQFSCSSPPLPPPPLPSRDPSVFPKGPLLPASIVVLLHSRPSSSKAVHFHHRDPLNGEFPPHSKSLRE